MSEVAQIRPELIVMYESVRVVSQRAARANPTLTTLAALQRRRDELARDSARLGFMDVRERAWHLGETAAVEEMIDEKLGLQREEST
jgi:hypothetical protein